MNNSFYPCKGTSKFRSRPSTDYHPVQQAWMILNKPLYYTGKIWMDLHHLPLELRKL